MTSTMTAMALWMTWQISECIEVPGEADCENVMNESGYCLTFYGNDLAYLGLDTGQVCPFVETGSSGSDSIAWVGTSVYHCGIAGGTLMGSMRLREKSRR